MSNGLSITIFSNKFDIFIYSNEYREMSNRLSTVEGVEQLQEVKSADVKKADRPQERLNTVTVILMDIHDTAISKTGKYRNFLILPECHIQDRQVQKLPHITRIHEQIINFALLASWFFMLLY